MKMLFTRSLGINSSEKAAWFLVWFSLPVSLKLNSISLILLAVVVLVSWVGHPFRPDKKKMLYMLPAILFFFWHARELLTGHPLLPIWKEVEQTLSFGVIPLIFSLSSIDTKSFTRSAMTGLITSLVLCGLIMLAAATARFMQTGNPGEFIYHDLAKPLHTGAIYISLYLVFALFKLDDPLWLRIHPRLKFSIGMFLLIILLLSASRVLIGLGIPLLAWHYRRFIAGAWSKHRRIVVITSMLFLAGIVPFLERVKPLIHPGLSQVKLNSFNTSPEPNGLTLRLIFWRFGFEILSENHAWITGTGMSRSQEYLNLKIIQHGMYTGSRIGNDTGYLNYNFHNQYMETLVRTGLAGLVILIMILFTFAFQPRDNLFTPKLFIGVIAALFLTESVLERQAGIVFFCLLYAAYFSCRNQVADGEK